MKIALIDNDGIITDICIIEKGIRPDENDINDNNIYEFDEDLIDSIKSQVESFPFHNFSF